MGRQVVKWCVAFALLTAACGSRTATATGPGSGGPVAEALSWVGCGPTDGPAIVIVIAEGPVACADRLTLQARDHIGLEIWGGAFPSPGQTFSLQGSLGAASVCRAGTCIPLDGATLTADGNDGAGWTGTLSYSEGGVTKKKSFRTTECVVQQMCG